MVARFQVAAGIVLALAALPVDAHAQAAPLAEGVTVGGWTFRPLAELRVRGEYRRYPVDAGGVFYRGTAVLEDAFGESTPEVIFKTARVKNQWQIGERARLGVGIDRGPVTGVITLQDSRVWGQTVSIFTPEQSTLPSFGPWEAYIDVHSRKGRRMFLRLGRQKVVWGDGRLVGESDWSATPRSLDAIRYGIQLGDVDVEAMGALLAAPGAVGPGTGTSISSSTGTGAQLYGADVVWHFVPLFAFELTGLVRIVREPRPIWLTPSDTYVADGRVFGDHRGFRYALEAAYELGRVASFGANRDHRAFALSGRADLETALPWHPTFGVQAAYATGDDGPGDTATTQNRFDPILPEQHMGLGPMGLYAWSNLIEAGVNLGLRPLDELEASLGYRLVALAEPAGRWSTAALLPVGASPTNDARLLGNEIDASLGWTPWDPIRFDLGYGLFLFGSAAKHILAAAQRCGLGTTGCAPPIAQHWAYLQATVRAP